MTGFYITVSNGLLKGHRKRMGSAVWEFMWLLDKITKIDEDGVGWVLGGKPIQLSEISLDLEIAQQHISENLSKLKKEGYIETIRTPRGLVVKVSKAKKRFNEKVKSDFTKRLNHYNEKVKSNKTIQRTIQLDSRIKLLKEKTRKKTRSKIEEIKAKLPSILGGQRVDKKTNGESARDRQVSGNIPGKFKEGGERKNNQAIL